ncbi:twin-arginine translocase TatA/TatE family subunit [Corynebacterium confusum]
MFSNLGVTEIVVIVLIAVVVIGPERLPGVLQDVRAAIFAARRAINNAKAELNGEVGEFSKEFDDLRGPLNQAMEWGRLGPRGVLTKALFDGDDSAWDDFNPKKFLDEPAAKVEQREESYSPYTDQPRETNTAAAGQGFDYSQIYAADATPTRQAEPPQAEQQPQAETRQAEQRREEPRPDQPSGFSWSDIS